MEIIVTTKPIVSATPAPKAKLANALKRAYGTTLKSIESADWFI
jgi:hypothetical protein